jgi:hypothetical protein
MKSRSTSYNIQVLTVEGTLIYAVDMPTNYTPTMKDNEELGARGSKVRKNMTIIGHANLLT